MPTAYTPREYAEMHYIYGLCDGNARQASLTYRERYPKRARHPDYRVFINVHNSYLEGRIPGTEKGDGRPRTIDEDEVLAEVEEDLSASIRRISRRTGVPKSTVHNILKRKRW